MAWENFIAGLLLFWPVVMLLFFIGFCFLVFAVFLVSGTFLIASIFMYGLYCILRDLGLLDWFLLKVGKASDWVTHSVKKNVEASFVFVKEKPLPSTAALYLCHPHGLYGLTWFVHFSTCLSKWPGKQRPVLAVHSIFFKIPILRELFLHNRCIEATEAEITRSLEKGQSVALLIGGIEELNATQPDALHLVLKKRSGYARIAKTCGVPLVPLISPSETNLFPAMNSFVWKKLQEFLYTQFHIATPLPSFNSLLSWLTIAYKSFDDPLKTYCLEEVNTDQKSIEDIKSEYLERILNFGKVKNVDIHLIG
jgi:hypothetical protein